jgi:hypothetical protein
LVEEAFPSDLISDTTTTNNKNTPVRRAIRGSRSFLLSNHFDCRSGCMQHTSVESFEVAAIATALSTI